MSTNNNDIKQAQSLEEILAHLPLMQKLAWLEKIQKDIQKTIPQFEIKCAIYKEKIVLLVDNATIAKRLSTQLNLLENVLIKYNLEPPKILIQPKNM
jgi:hypothetical protein